MTRSRMLPAVVVVVALAGAARATEPGGPRGPRGVLPDFAALIKRTFHQTPAPETLPPPPPEPIPAPAPGNASPAPAQEEIVAVEVPRVPHAEAPPAAPCCPPAPGAASCWERFWEWLTYHPLSKGCWCYCHKQCEPCGMPPLYIFFLCDRYHSGAHGCASCGTAPAPHGDAGPNGQP